MTTRALVWIALTALVTSQAACSIKKVTFKPIGPGGAGGIGGAAGAAGKGGIGGASGMGGAGGMGGAAGAAGVAGGGGMTGAAGAAGGAGTRDAGVDRFEAGSPPMDAGRRDAIAHAVSVDGAIADAGGKRDASGDVQSGADGPPPCPLNMVPAMTGPTMPSGSVFESGSIDSTTYDGWQAFDSSNTTMWISAIGDNPAIIGYAWDNGVPHVVVSYAITYANGSILTRAPSAWTFEGLSGDEWLPIDTREGETGWAGFERRVYTVASPGNYSQYRLNITDDNDPTPGIVVISISQLELFGCPATGPQ